MEIAQWAAAMVAGDSIAQNYHKRLIRKPWLRAPFWQALCSTAEPAPQVRKMDWGMEIILAPTVVEMNFIVYLCEGAQCVVEFSEV